MVVSQRPNLRARVVEFVGAYSKAMTIFRAARPQWLWRATSPLGEPTIRLANTCGLSVRRGPFEGIKFSPDALGHSNYLAAKILGTYEPAIVDFIAQHAPSADVFAEIGSSDGFFCIGALNAGATRSIGYEVNRFERSLAAKNAAANRCSIDLRGFADSEAIGRLPAGRLLLLVDIEGLEEDLLNPEVSPRLQEATIVVEIHENFRPNVATVLTDRFRTTHAISRIEASPASPAEVPELQGWDYHSAELAVYDGHRPGDGVAWMTLIPT